MKSRLPIALFLAGVVMSSTIYAVAAPVDSPLTMDKKDNPPRPKPKPGPRDGGDD